MGRFLYENIFPQLSEIHSSSCLMFDLATVLHEKKVGVPLIGVGGRDGLEEGE